MLACCCWLFNAATAQQNHLKLYLGFELASRTTLQPPADDKGVYQYAEIYASQPFYALAFAHEKNNGNFWEISGLTNAYVGGQKIYDFRGRDTLVFEPLVEAGREQNHFAQLQCEYNWLQGCSDDRKVKPYLGLFLRASGQWASFRPALSEFYPLEHWSTTLASGFIPRLAMQFGDRWRLDLSAPIVLGYFGVSGSTVENPSLTYEQQRNSSFELNMLNLDTQIRLGVSYRLNKREASK